MKRFFCAFLSAALLLVPGAMDLSAGKIIQNGKVTVTVTRHPGSSRIIKHAAKELSLYLGKLAGSRGAFILSKPGKDYTILLTTDLKDLTAKEKELAGKVRHDGFILSTTPGRTVIYGKIPRGVLYGAYHILKKYGQIRWITPGKDGEYYSIRKDLTLPAELSLHNPSFKIRSQIMGSANANSVLKDSWDWMVRNNMWVTASSEALPKYGAEYLLDRDGRIYIGGHFIACLMTGAGITCNGRQARKNLVKLQKEHPEYFPIINGVREGGRYGENNPCLAAESLFDLMRKNLELKVSKLKFPKSFIIIGNNDNTSWCQCSYCVKLDPPAEAKSQTIPTRYWNMVNSLAKPVLDKNPKVDLWGWAYQNFHAPPQGVKPDPRLTVMLVYNARCYRHTLDDPKCPTNKRYFQYFKDWQKFPNIKCAWEQVEDGMAVGYHPFENVFARNILLYKKLNFDGMMLCNYPPDGTYQKRHDNYHVHNRHMWGRMWRSIYVASLLLWDVNADWKKALDEAGRLYYGAGWEKGMKEYCALLLKTEEAGEGCMGWGSAGSEAGKLLSDPKVHKTLKALLASAESAVIYDPRSAYHILKDKMYFEKTWERALAQYRERRGDIIARKKTAPIVLDGKLDEPDWKKAVTVTDFTAMGRGDGQKRKARYQTAYKVIWEEDYLYIGATAYEPEMHKIKANCTKRDGDVWPDNSMEFFIHHPYLNANYFHLCITSNGALYDGFKIWGRSGEDESWSSNAQYKIAKNKTNWVIELKIPASAIRFKLKEKDLWKINVSRNRKILNGRYMIEDELSSSSGGRYHNSEFFTNLILHK